MAQSTKFQLKDAVAEAIKKAGFNYEFTELDSTDLLLKRPIQNGCDVYRNEACTHLISRMHKSDENGVNFYISDARISSNRHNPLAPSHGNIVFQGGINTSVKVDIILKLIGYTK